MKNPTTTGAKTHSAEIEVKNTEQRKALLDAQHA